MSPDMPGSKKRPLSWFIMTVILTNIGFGIIILWSALQFGTLEGARSYIIGHRIIPDSYTKYINIYEHEYDYDRVTFMFKNFSMKTIRILGLRTPCACMISENLPRAVPPGSEQPITIHFPKSQGDRVGRENLVLYTDYPNQRATVLRVVGRKSSPERAGRRAR